MSKIPPCPRCKQVSIVDRFYICNRICGDYHCFYCTIRCKECNKENDKLGTTIHKTTCPNCGCTCSSIHMRPCGYPHCFQCTQGCTECRMKDFDVAQLWIAEIKGVK